VYDLKYKWVWLILGLLLVASITTVSLLPSRSLPKINLDDKTLHFLAYFIVTCWFVGLAKKKHYILLGLLFLVFSYGIEILQGMSRYRQFEWSDMLANGTGIFSALVLGLIFMHGWCQVFERKLLKIPHP
jgi:VanZ family protein